MAVGWLYVLLRVKDKRKVALIMAVSKEVSLLNWLNERYRSQIIRLLTDKNASALDYNNIPIKQKDANTLDVHLQTSIFSFFTYGLILLWKSYFHTNLDKFRYFGCKYKFRLTYLHEFSSSFQEFVNINDLHNKVIRWAGTTWQDT